MLKRMFAAALLVCGLAFCSSAKADSYTFSVVGNADQNYFVNGNDFGDYEIHVGQVSMYCGATANTCYGTHIAATNTTTYTTYQTVLATDPNPVAGSGCSYSGPATFSICTNGHEVVYGINGDHLLYTVSGQTLTSVYGGGFEFVQQSENGNLFFSDTVHENLIVGIASTVTPEPSSLALLGTGVLGVIGAARRRFAA